MFTHQATPPHPLGLSVGATNLAGAGDAYSAAVRPSVVTLHGQRLTGFVDRIGDPVPIVGPDGSHHRPEALLADALHTVAQAATHGVDATEVAVAVPAHWPPAVVAALRRTLQQEVVSDAAAALTRLNADPGLPRHGVVVLCDFGGSGTSITLADAAADHALIGDTVRFADFSGDLVDQALLRHVAASFADTASDPSGTAMVGSLTRLRADCRAAKERLSDDTATTITVDVPGHRAEFRVTRAELEALMQGPLTDFLVALDDTLQRRRIPAAAVSAVATVGGGARIPLVTQLLSERLRVPVVTTPHPALTAAQGAALIAQRSGVVETATALAPAAEADALTSTFDGGAPSSTFGALAWSQEDGCDADVLFASADTGHQPAGFRPDLSFHHEPPQHSERVRRAPLVMFSLAAAAAVITTAVFGVTQLSGYTATPVEAATTVAPSSAPAAPVNTPAPPAPQAPPVTTVVVQPAKGPGPAPRSQAPAPHAVAPPVVVPPPSAPATTTSPTTPPPAPPSTPPETPPSPTAPPPPSPEPPPIDPGPDTGDAPDTTTDAPAELPPAPPETEGES